MRAKTFLGTAVGLGAAGATYSFLEPYLFRLVEHRLVGGAQVPPVTVLHVSDTHLSASDTARARWVRSLPERISSQPDLVIATGDLINDDSGIAPAVEALGGLEGRWGSFYVLGSHDYYQARFETYLKYLHPGREQRSARAAATGDLETGLKAAGWVPLTNSTEVLETDLGRVRLCGVDDPYLGRHRTDHLTRMPGDDLAIAVMHAPDLVSNVALAGFDLALAGHTHGGQVRVPMMGAIVTNCTLPAALAAGPHQIGAMWLHVSPGLGTGRYAPIRFNCRPEATILRLGPPLT
ncbi:MAG TPA: metallophosphoesterase [Actinomycetota bacterium]|nr:metallophosphoesterase [Actinomycetota bacterium]